MNGNGQYCQFPFVLLSLSFDSVRIEPRRNVSDVCRICIVLHVRRSSRRIVGRRAPVRLRLRSRIAPRRRRSPVLPSGTQEQRRADQQRQKHKADRKQRFGLFVSVFGACRFDKRGDRRAEKRKRGQYRKIFKEHERRRFIVIKKREGRAEKDVIRDAVFDEKPEAYAGYDRKYRRNSRFYSAVPFESRRHRRDMQPEVEAHEDKRPEGHGQMKPPCERYGQHPVQKRHRVRTHRHTAERGKRDRGEQQRVHCDGYDAVGVVFSLEKRFIPSEIKDMVNYQQDRHRDPAEFVERFARHLVRHQAKQEDGHQRVDHLFYCIFSV